MKGEYDDVVRELQAANSAGQTVIASRRLRVLVNDAWSTTEGEARVTWVYGERVPRWERLLRPEIRAAIAAGNRRYPTGPVQWFPFFLMTGQNTNGSIALTPVQMNLLADLTCWNILDNAATFRAMLNGRRSGHAQQAGIDHGYPSRALPPLGSAAQAPDAGRLGPPEECLPLLRPAPC